MTSFNELRRDGLAVERHNRMHPDKPAKQSYVSKMLADCKGPVIAATDYMRLFADQIRPYIDAPYVTLGTDGYGRSDTRERLRHFFEVDAKYIVLATLSTLAEIGDVPKSAVIDAMKRYGIDRDKLDPVTI